MLERHIPCCVRQNLFSVERNELRRALPPGAWLVLERAERHAPETVRDFLDMYDTATEVYWWGDWKGDAGYVATGGETTSWSPADERLGWIKARIDRYLSLTAQTLIRYERECRQEASERPAATE